MTFRIFLIIAQFERTPSIPSRCIAGLEDPLLEGSGDRLRDSPEKVTKAFTRSTPSWCSISAPKTLSVVKASRPLPLGRVGVRD